MIKRRRQLGGDTRFAQASQRPQQLPQTLVGLLLWCGLISGCGLLPSLTGTPPPTPEVHLLLGNPSGAVSDPNSPNNYLIVRPQYALSYNRDKGIPNWASWQLNPSWLGDLPRGPFATDTSLPATWYRVRTDDYTGSGFDRGHVVPAADRNQKPADGESVFLMTNIIPQAADNNRGPWEKLERYCRDLTKQGKELYIISGWAGSGGKGERGKKTAIARGKVAVPAATWKIVVVLNQPGLGLESIRNDTRVIAVIMPNAQGIKNDDWRSYRQSVDTVEQITGYDFLSNLPTATQTILEAKVDKR